MVKENKCNWNDILHHVKFNPNEDSAQLYPHLQGRRTLTLSKAVEVMIACHDSYVAQSVVMYCGGWDLCENVCPNVLFKNLYTRGR